MKIRKGTGVQYLAPKIIEPPLQSHRKSRGGGCQYFAAIIIMNPLFKKHEIRGKVQYIVAIIF